MRTVSINIPEWLATAFDWAKPKPAYVVSYVYGSGRGEYWTRARNATEAARKFKRLSLHGAMIEEVYPKEPRA